ncbi:hypothetical protein ADK59_38465 [Streptomyces sp. XY332]|nr:hypothetical protein ADK59_38465 [Streptomyces sp. XY332]
MLGQEPRPGGRLLLLLEPLADVVAVHQHAGGDVRQLAVGVDEVGGDAVVPLPVQGPRAVPILVDRGQLRRAFRCSFRVLPEAVLGAFASEVGHVLSDGHHLVVLAPHGVLPRGEVPGGLPVGPQCGELVLPRLFAGFPYHPGFRRIQEGLAVAGQ